MLPMGKKPMAQTKDTVANLIDEGPYCVVQILRTPNSPDWSLATCKPSYTIWVNSEIESYQIKPD